MAEQVLLILVGVTGVGKSTTVESLAAAGLSFSLLPNRRELTDDLIITWLQQQAGQPVTPVNDRTERFAYTRRYRERFPGGMAHALSQLQVNPATLPTSYLLFDGLRGENEVRHAAQLLPKASFIVLDAPHFVRVQRLLGRGDLFDQVETTQLLREVKDEIQSLADLDLVVDDLFTPEEEAALIQLVQRGQIATADLQAKLKIVLTEHRNYDPAAAIAALQAVAPQRTIIMDTTRHPAADVAQLVVQHLSDYQV